MEDLQRLARVGRTRAVARLLAEEAGAGAASPRLQAQAAHVVSHLESGGRSSGVGEFCAWLLNTGCAAREPGGVNLDVLPLRSVQRLFDVGSGAASTAPRPHAACPPLPAAHRATVSFNALRRARTTLQDSTSF